jgi:flagellar biosynthetic protein FlhB
MASDDFGDKTEEPTDRRRQEAREKGNVARSNDLNAASLMLGAALAMLLFGMPVTKSLAAFTRRYLGGEAWRSVDRNSVAREFGGVLEQAAAAVLPLLLFMAAVAIFSNLVQVGFLLSPDTIQPKLARVSPLQGLKRIFSMQSLVKLGASLGKLIAVVAVAAWAIWSPLPEFLGLIGADPASIMEYTRQSLVALAFQLAAVLLLLAVLDFGFQKWKHSQELKMTKQEVREELKNMEGDPHIRHRRREAHRKLAQAREINHVKDADVVITNPTEIAVALKYDPEKMPAPTVVAKGMGEIAARIRRIATEHGVPIIERKPLARLLYRDVKVGQAIPVELYEVFVEIMAYIYRLAGKAPPKLDG